MLYMKASNKLWPTYGRYAGFSMPMDSISGLCDAGPISSALLESVQNKSLHFPLSSQVDFQVYVLKNFMNLPARSGSFHGCTSPWHRIKYTTYVTTPIPALM